MKEYPVELIQVAAVAVAAYQDWLGPIADVNNSDTMSKALTAIALERARQDKEWGPQTHTQEEWLTILAEEMGEVAEAINKGMGR